MAVQEKLPESFGCAVCGDGTSKILQITVDGQMSEDVGSNLIRFRGSVRARRIGSSVFAAMVALYLAVITYSPSDRLDSTKAIVALVFLWLIGIVTLAFILRAHRRATSAK